MNIANRDTGNFVHFWWSFHLSIHIPHFNRCRVGRFTFTKVVRIIVDTGLSVAHFFMRLYTGKIYKSVVFDMIKSVSGFET